MADALKNGIGDPYLARVFVGARGSGKTALLTAVFQEAGEHGWISVATSAPPAWFEWARMGHAVVSISYRRIPEVMLASQIADVMDALSYLSDHAQELGLNLGRCFLTGDPAGALLASTGVDHELLEFPCGGERKLVHVFSVGFPHYPESRAVREAMGGFFRAQNGA